mgnify:CR=1 FL=1
MKDGPGFQVQLGNELSLDGSVRHVRGVLPMAALAREIVALTPDFHLDISYRAKAEYDPPRELRDADGKRVDLKDRLGTLSPLGRD